MAEHAIECRDPRVTLMALCRRKQANNQEIKTLPEVARRLTLDQLKRLNFEYLKVISGIETAQSVGFEFPEIKVTDRLVPACADKSNYPFRTSRVRPTDEMPRVVNISTIASCYSRFQSNGSSL